MQIELSDNSGIFFPVLTGSPNLGPKLPVINCANMAQLGHINSTIVRS